MQLSLSSSVSAPSEATLPGLPAPDATVDQEGPATAGSAPRSFEECFPAAESPAKPSTAETGPDAEKSAAILAASFWMPATALPVAPLPELPLTGARPDDLPADTASGSITRPSVFFAAPSSRAFASVTVRVVAPEPAGGVVADPAADPQSLPEAAAPLLEPVPIGSGGIKPAAEMFQAGVTSEIIAEGPGPLTKPAGKAFISGASQVRAAVPARLL